MHKLQDGKEFTKPPVHAAAGPQAMGRERICPR
jgi:hypothetical protein